MEQVSSQDPQTPVITACREALSAFRACVEKLTPALKQQDTEIADTIVECIDKDLSNLYMAVDDMQDLLVRPGQGD